MNNPQGNHRYKYTATCNGKQYEGSALLYRHYRTCENAQLESEVKMACITDHGLFALPSDVMINIEYVGGES